MIEKKCVLTVLVVSDQVALRVGRERRLPGPRESEEESGVALLALVGRAVHGHHAVQRQPVVHHGEDALLHLTPVPTCFHARFGVYFGHR